MVGRPASESGSLIPARRVLRRIFQDYQLYLLPLPALLWYAIFAYGPIYGLQIAFKDFNGALGIWGSRWVGLKHFNNFFASYYFWPLIRNTVIISVYSIAAGFPIPILFALMLNEIRSMKYRKLVQTVTYAPHFISTVVLVGMIIVILSPTYGIVNSLIKQFGGTPRSFMTDPNAFRHIYVWSGVWQSMGWSSIIYLAALSAVDPELHEAAIIDGASRLQRVIYINVPVLVPTMVILFILSAGSVMNVGFEKVFLMQNDLNSETSDVIATYIYRRGLISADFSFSSAVGLFNNMINFALLYLVNLIARRVGDMSLF